MMRMRSQGAPGQTDKSNQLLQGEAMSDAVAVQDHDGQRMGKEEKKKSLIKHIRKAAAALKGLALPAVAQALAAEIVATACELEELFSDSQNLETVAPAMVTHAAGGEKKGPALNPGLALHKGRQYAHILIAEDNELTRTLALNMIEHQGWRATAVDSGRHVLEALKHEHFDLVIMDVHMSELNGIEATRIIREMERENARQRRLPIIALTSLDSKEDRQLCFQAGMDEFVSKGMHLNDLIAAIDRQLAKSYIPARGSAGV